MSFSLIAKVFTGFAVTGGIASTPFLLISGKANLKKSTQNLDRLDRGKFQLEREFQGCEQLLEDKTRQKDFEQIYLCALGDGGKFELIYYNTDLEGVNKISKEIKSLSPLAGKDYSPKLRVELEDSQVKTLDWPRSLFDYVSASSLDEKTTLFPKRDCNLTTGEASKLFECNETWIVVKLKVK